MSDSSPRNRHADFVPSVRSNLPHLSIYDASQIEQQRRELRIDPERLRRYRNATLKQFRSEEELQREFREFTHFHGRTLKLEERHDSHSDGAVLALLFFRLDQPALVKYTLEGSSPNAPRTMASPSQTV